MRLCRRDHFVASCAFCVGAGGIVVIVSERAARLCTADAACLRLGAGRRGVVVPCRATVRFTARCACLRRGAGCIGVIVAERIALC